ncbi:MAG: TylF/MycF/NovP-related O-methyltransferase [Burkholderiales bacterium]
MALLKKLRAFTRAFIRMPLNAEAIALAAARPVSVEVRAPDVHVAAPVVEVPAPMVTVPAPVINLPPSSPWRDIAPNSEAALFKALSDSALSRTVQIVEQEMPEAVILLDNLAFLRLALSKASPNGAHCEFGVFSGTTINYLAEQRPDIRFDGFDSFRGLPTDWSGYTLFDFDRQGEMPDVRANVVLHPGWFDDTLPAYAAGIDRVAFAHVDCDLYSSTATIFRHLGPKMAAGCVIAFDEYYCYPGFELHERRAFSEFLVTSGWTARWFACCGQRAACILE